MSSLLVALSRTASLDAEVTKISASSSQMCRIVRSGDEVIAALSPSPRVLVAFITDPDVTAQILSHLGIATEPIVVSPAPPQTFDDFA